MPKTGPSPPRRWRPRHRLPARHLEPVLQALVRQGILKGVRGPRGGYELGREAHRITANDILRAAGTIDDSTPPPAKSNLLTHVVMPALAQAEIAFATALSHINVEDLLGALDIVKKPFE